jgi:hypothetical protein
VNRVLYDCIAARAPFRAFSVSKKDLALFVLLLSSIMAEEISNPWSEAISQYSPESSCSLLETWRYEVTSQPLLSILGVWN